MTEKMEWTKPQITIINIDDTESGSTAFAEAGGVTFFDQTS